MTTVVIDHGCANLFSLTQALHSLGEQYIVSREPAVIEAASRLVLPGVGSFGDVMKAMQELTLVEPLHKAAKRRTPLLGICVGMQILADRSEEFGEHTGLGLVPGVVRRLPEEAGGGQRVPNVGWRVLYPRADDPLMGDVADGTMAYFVHSYAFEPKESSVVAATIKFNDTMIAAAIHQDNVTGYQFHPEKSGADGLALIRQFFRKVPAAQ